MGEKRLHPMAKIIGHPLLPVATFIAGGLVVYLWLGSGENPMSKPEVEKKVTVSGSQTGMSPSQAPSRTKSSERPRPAGGGIKVEAVGDVDRLALKEDLIRRWNDGASKLQGEALIEFQRGLVLEAVRLGASDEMLAFATFMKEKGANDAWHLLLTEVGIDVFSGANAEGAREWLAKVTDLKARERLCFQAGKFYNGGDLKGFIKTFQPDPQSQSAVLTSYTANLAKTDPEAAVKMFFELRPGNVDFTGLSSVMAGLSPTADFAKISSMIGEDSRGTLAARARSSLLKSWVSADPESAAQYVLSNSGTASPEQMAVVTQTWSEQSPDHAANWIRNISPGKVRDEGNRGLAKYWLQTDPASAWQFAVDVGEPKKQAEVAMMVYREWEKIDPASAANAWNAAFPPGQ